MKKLLIILVFVTLFLTACGVFGSLDGGSIPTPSPQNSAPNVELGQVPVTPETSTPAPTPAVPTPPSVIPAPPLEIPDYITIRDQQFSTSLTELDLGRWSLEDHEMYPLRYMVNLTELSIANSIQWAAYQQLTDISALAGLTNLTGLSLAGNRISDITPLAGLTNLEWLEIGGNLVTDLSPISGLTNLTSIGFMHNQISDIQALANLTNLEFLTMSSNQITDISPLSNMPHLHFINMEFNQVSNLAPLTGINNLVLLYAGGNPISDLTPLAGMDTLNELSLYTAQIRDVSPLANLRNLVHLNLNDNQISDVRPLASLQGTNTHILLDNNTIIDWSPLINFDSVGGRNVQFSEGRINVQVTGESHVFGHFSYGIEDIDLNFIGRMPIPQLEDHWIDGAMWLSTVHNDHPSMYMILFHFYYIDYLVDDSWFPAISVRIVYNAATDTIFELDTFIPVEAVTWELEEANALALARLCMESRATAIEFLEARS